MPRFDQAKSARRYGSINITSNIVFLVATTTSVALRLVAKQTTKASYGLDDAFIIAAQLLWFAGAGLEIYSSDVGRNLQSVMDPGFSTFLKYIYIEGILYAPTILCISTSVLLFYRRIFPVEEFKRPVAVLIGIHVAWALTVFFGQVFICTPVKLVYAGAIAMVENEDKCMQYRYFFLIMMCIELLLNVAVLALPIRQILKLHMMLPTRLVLVVIFLLGGASLVSGILRIQQTYLPGDRYIDLAADMFWLTIHVCTALIAASLPTYRPLMRILATFMSTNIRKVYSSGSNTTRESMKQPNNFSLPSHDRGYFEVPAQASRGSVREAEKTKEGLEDTEMDNYRLHEMDRKVYGMIAEAR